MSEDYRAMISGYLDGELDEGERAAFEARLRADPALQAELEEMRRMVTAASEINVPPPPEDVWDTFLDRVYNRVERRVGWVFFWAGLAAGPSWLFYLAVILPWASPLTKLVLALPVAGLTVLFVSVLRERLFIARTDRYSRDVKR